MSSPTTTAPTVPANPRSRVIIASLVGTTIEFYDFYVYATAAVLVFPILFFPDRQRDDLALCCRSAVFGAAMVARPLGAVIFGHFGDRFGRKAHSRGIPAHDGHRDVPHRLPSDVQRRSAGWRRRFSCSSSASSRASPSAANGRARRSSRPRTPPPGSVPGTGRSRSWAPRSASSSPTAVFLVINFALPHPDGPAQPLRRVPRVGLARAFPVLRGHGDRRPLGAPAARRVAESFTKASRSRARSASSRSAAVLRGNWRHLILGTFIMLATYVLFYLMTSFTLSFGTKPTSRARRRPPRPRARRSMRRPTCRVSGSATPTSSSCMIIGVVFFGIFTMLSGPLADSIGRRKLLAVGHVVASSCSVCFTVFLSPQADPKFTGALVHGVPHLRVPADGLDVRPDGRGPSRALPDERALHRLGDLLQRVVDPRRRARTDRRGRAVGRGRRKPVGSSAPICRPWASSRSSRCSSRPRRRTSTTTTTSASERPVRSDDVIDRSK